MTPITTADIERLRRRIDRVEGGRMEPAPALRPTEEPVVRYDAEKSLDGEIVENELGKCFVSERFYPHYKLHGTFEFSRLNEMSGAWLQGISKGEIPDVSPRKWVFLDTETTGLAGGTGTCAFLIGVGVIEPEGFRVRLFFMRDYDEEAAMLRGLSDFLAQYEVLVTYNGKSYDAPLIETRYRLQRQRFPLEEMHHLDLLHGSRSLWKLRMENCRLIKLEYEILGFEREGDLPGELIPYYYFEYLKTKQSFKLVPMFHHNAMDIVSLACLTGVVLPAYAAPEEAVLHHGADMLGLARWLKRVGDVETACSLYRKAVQAGMADNELFAALWETALLEKKRGRHAEKVEILLDLAGSPNPCRAKAAEELAKHYEHRDKDFQQALQVAESAYGLEPTEGRERRLARLRKRLEKQQTAAAKLPLDPN